MDDEKIIVTPPESEFGYGDGDIPEIDLPKENVEPLPESTRPRKDGPGGN